MRTAVIFVAALSMSVLNPVYAGTDAPTALRALKFVPEDQLKNLARMEGPDGAFAPEEWHVLVHSPESETGLKEYVVANGGAIAAREVSQFAETLSADDVIGADAVQVDSDTVEKIAADYAKVNNLKVASLNYHLGKDGKEAQPVWRLTCLDDAGHGVGELVVTASKGKVVSHEGFALQPPSKAQPPKKPKMKTVARPEVVVNQPRPAPEVRRPVEQKPARSAAKPEPIAERGKTANSDVPQDREVRRAEPVRRGETDPTATAGDGTHPIGQALRRLFRSN